MSKTIALIGLSGCGKTTYGYQLAERLNRPFYDTDQIIERKENMSVSEIFKKKGEAYFRKREWEIFEELCQGEISVISTGGGLIPYAVEQCFEKPELVFFLYLNTSVSIITQRLQNPELLKTRPLLADENDLYGKIEKLYIRRAPAYLAWADAIMTTN